MSTMKDKLTGALALLSGLGVCAGSIGFASTIPSLDGKAVVVASGFFVGFVMLKAAAMILGNNQTAIVATAKGTK